MLIQENKLLFPIEYYSNRLIDFCTQVLEMEILQDETYSSKEAKKRLRWMIFNNTTMSLKTSILAVKITNRISDEIKKKIFSYITCIMTLLGKLGECLFIDYCMNYKDVNMKAINIALFQNDIYSSKPEIDYDNYIPFGTSFKYLFTLTESGIYYRTEENPHHNPNDKQRDIGWHLKDHKFSQLQVNINQNDVIINDNAKIQVKTTSNCSNLDISQYPTTPIVCFDICNDINDLKTKNPNRIIYSMRDICIEAELEIEYFFKILAAFATGIEDHINIRNLDIDENDELAQLMALSLNNFRSAPFDSLTILTQNILDNNINGKYSAGV